MADQTSDWYTDPTGRYQYRYWNGVQWSDQVSNGGPSGTDPNPLDPNIAATPPAPGSRAAAPPQAEPAAPQPAVQVSQSSGGIGFGVILGALLALVAVVVVLVVLLSNSDDSTTTTEVPDTTSAPVTTEAP
jgi:hypothetical protein